MIDASEIREIASETGLNPYVVEKDYVIGWVLAGIYMHPEICEGWVFKVPGGPTSRITPCNGKTLRGTFARTVKLSTACASNWRLIRSSTMIESHSAPSSGSGSARRRSMPLGSGRSSDWGMNRFCMCS